MLIPNFVSQSVRFGSVRKAPESNILLLFLLASVEIQVEIRVPLISFPCPVASRSVRIEQVRFRQFMGSKKAL